MNIKYLGHSTFIVEWNDKHLLIDPFISDNPLASKVDINGLEVDYILITHGHSDHIGDVEVIAKRTGATLISSFEIVTWFADKGFSGHPMNVGGKHKFDFGWVKCVSAIHSSKLPDGQYGGPAMGFVIYDEQKTLYISGDTALHTDMKLIPIMVGKVDAAILCIGDNFTMGYEDALFASSFIQCNKIIGCHFDTFGYIKIDQNKAIQTFLEAGKELILLPIGNSTTI